MLTSLCIQNFRSIRDASVKLGQVNLFIGPNNSGKSNFLKGIEFISNRIAAYPNEQVIPVEWYEQNLPRNNQRDFLDFPVIQIQLNYRLSQEIFCEVDCAIKANYITRKETILSL